MKTFNVKVYGKEDIKPEYTEDQYRGFCCLATEGFIHPFDETSNFDQICTGIAHCIKREEMIGRTPGNNFTVYMGLNLQACSLSMRLAIHNPVQQPYSIVDKLNSVLLKEK